MIESNRWSLRSAAQPEIEALMPDYLQEMARYTDVPRNPGGKMTYPYLPHYWQEPDRTPYLILVEDEMVGFVLVRRLKDPETGDSYHSMAEFFVGKSVRRLGIGAAVAEQVLKSRPGAWEVSVLKTNAPARPFWQQLMLQLDPGLTSTESGDSIRYFLTV